MAFCKYCGKPLNEGEVCNCAGNMAAQQTVPNQQMNDSAQVNQGQPMNNPQMNNPQMNQGQFVNNGQNMNGMYMNGQQPNGQFNAGQMQQKANEYMQQGMVVANNAWKNLLGIFKAPAQAGRQYVEKADMVVSLVLIALQAVIAGIFGLICIMKMNTLFSSISSSLSYLLSSSSMSKAFKLSGAKAFFITLIFSLIFSALFALIFFVAGKIVKSNIDFNKALAITSIRSAAVIPFMLVGCIIALLNVPYGMGIFYLGNILAICFIYAAMTGLCEENKLSYVIAVAILVFIIITVFVMGKAVMLYLPSGLKGLGSMSSMMDLFY